MVAVVAAVARAYPLVDLAEAGTAMVVGVATAVAVEAMAQTRVDWSSNGSNHNRDGPRDHHLESKDSRVNWACSGFQKFRNSQYRPSPAHMIDRHQHRTDFHYNHK